MGLGKVIKKEERNHDTLKGVVKQIYSVFKETEDYVFKNYSDIEKILLRKYFYNLPGIGGQMPGLNPIEREYALLKKRGCLL